MATKLPFGLTRAQLVKAMSGDETIARALEQVILTFQSSADISTSTAAATTELQDATAVTLSPNATLNNERILAVASPLVLDDQGPGNDVVIGMVIDLSFPAIHALIINLLTDTNITLPPTGRLLAADITNVTYANDAAAAAAGIAVGEAYRQPAGVVTWRQV